MKTISRADLVALGGAPDAWFAVLNADGSLYISVAAQVSHDQYRWHDIEDRPMEMKRVEE